MSIKWQNGALAFPGTGMKTNELTITQFTEPKIFRSVERFKTSLMALSADDVPYTCIYCREGFTGCGVWAAVFDARTVLNIHIVFSCRTCFREMEALKPRLAEKMRAKGLRRLFALLAAAKEMKN